MADQLSCAKPLDWDAPDTEVLSLAEFASSDFGARTLPVGPEIHIIEAILPGTVWLDLIWAYPFKSS
jgi:hypothetical protein